jgi:hypothetical protein
MLLVRLRRKLDIYWIKYSDITDTQFRKGQCTLTLFCLFARYFSALKTETATAFRQLHTNCHTTYCHIQTDTNVLNSMNLHNFFQVQINLCDNKQ